MMNQKQIERLDRVSYAVCNASTSVRHAFTDAMKKRSEMRANDADPEFAGILQDQLDAMIEMHRSATCNLEQACYAAVHLADPGGTVSDYLQAAEMCAQSATGMAGDITRALTTPAVKVT